jgi:YebC/PmpR family DNA-binding regulatory protein
MSGHSHWHTIKNKKGAEDAKKSKIFSKMAREITVAARGGGGDLGFNPKLRMIVDKAKSVNMPNDSIDKAIKKGTGELKGEQLEEVLFEAYGPDGIAILIEGITDNSKRTITDLKQILSKNGGKLVNEGAIKWMFEKKGVILLDNTNINKDDFELELIDLGAEDINFDEEIIEITTSMEDLENIRKALDEKGYTIKEASLSWIANEKMNGDAERVYKLFEAIDDCDDVKEIYSNLND